MAFELSREKFKNAVGILADEKERIKERLLIAYASQLSGIDERQDLPKSLVDPFRGLKYALSDADVAYGYGEHAAKKIHDMSEDEASNLAREIYSIFLTLHELKAQEMS